MKVIKLPTKVFRARCPHCFAVLEYNIGDIDHGYVQCPCCGDWFNHREYATPFEETLKSVDKMLEDEDISRKIDVEDKTLFNAILHMLLIKQNIESEDNK